MAREIDWTRSIDAGTRAMAIAYATRSAELDMARGEPWMAVRTARQLVMAEPDAPSHAALLREAQTTLAATRERLDTPLSRADRARTLLALGDYRKAMTLYQAEAQANSRNVDAFLGFAWCMLRLARYPVARDIAVAAKAFSDDLRADAILVHVAVEERNPVEAESMARAALTADPRVAAWLPFGAAYEAYGEAGTIAGELGPALDDIAATLHLSRIAHANRMRDFHAMAQACEDVLAVIPNDIWAASFAVTAYTKLDERLVAVAAQTRLVQLANGHPGPLAQVFTHLFNIFAFEEAREIGLLVMDLTPDDDSLRASLAYACAQVGDTQSVERLIAPLGGVPGERMKSNPFVLLGLSDDPAQQLAAASACAAMKAPATPLADAVSLMPPVRPDRIRVGFFSNDFHAHPVGKLIPGLLAHLDRSRFEVICYSYDTHPDDAERQRLREASDAFIDVTAIEGDDLVNHMRREAIHVLIDMKGYTDHSRITQMQRRMAPVQASWFGFSATTGTPEIDYVIADPIVIPHGAERFYSEKVVRLPDTFFPYDPGQRVGHVPTREAAGLPTSGTVFASFNQPFKLNETMMAAWARILREVPGSVLWLQARPLPTQDRLRATAARHGLDPDRLVFAPRTDDPADHLARYGLVDLALDTFPYGSHTTSADALFGGAPILTIQGRSFAARVSSSIVCAHGMPQLVSTSVEEYVAKAIAIGNDPALAASLKALVVANRSSRPLFDPARQAAGFGAALETMVERWLAGQPPQSFDVPAMQPAEASRRRA